MLLAASPAGAELNRFEANTLGEFNRGSAQQFGGTNQVCVAAAVRRLSLASCFLVANSSAASSFLQKKVDFVKEYGKDLRLSNFTATDMRGSSLKGADLRGAYLMKAVAPDSDFSGADLSDALMDRAVFVNSNFENAILARVVLTLSDLQGANVTNADFSDALLDKVQQEKLCKTAAGRNPVTGADTRKSLGCGGRPRGSPSLYMTDDSSKAPEALFDASRFSSYSTQ